MKMSFFLFVQKIPWIRTKRRVISLLIMAQRVKISCINKNDRYSAYEKISHVGGVNDNGTRWKLTISEAIRSIENGTYSFYTSVGGHIRNVVVSSRNGSKYLRTEADADTPDNLLSLPECP